jgi:methionyl-tRNA formyltransferase
MRILYFGSAQFGVPCLEAIHQSDHDLVGAFTQPARPAGRHRSHPKPTDVAIWCEKNDIPCIEARNINAPDMVEKIASFGADLLVVIAFGQKIGPDVINMHTQGAINVHGSLLPKYRGAAPIHWAIMNGETETGITIITLADRMDAGLMLATGKIQITHEDTVKTVHDRLSDISAPVLLKTITQIVDGTATYTEQDEALVTKAPKLQRKHGYIDWNRPALSIVDQIHALWPWPGAQSTYVCSKTGKSWRVSISKAQVVDQIDNESGVTGSFDENLHVICGKNALKIIELKPAGSHLMDFQAYVNGHQCSKGDLFISDEKAMNGSF